MVFGIGQVIGISAAIGVTTWAITFFYCGGRYTEGKVAGMQEEASAWVEAFESVQPPNWQSLPVNAESPLPREKQDMLAKLYVEMFGIIKEVIGKHMAMHRIEVLCKVISGDEK
jgi:hypothetical protein